LDESDLATTLPDERLLAIDEALDQLAKEDQPAAELVKLRFFAGFSISEAAEILGMSRSNAYAQWAYARAWLQSKVESAE
jgi:RNA polymerase sigma factor (sigma-70 family)